MDSKKIPYELIVAMTNTGLIGDGGKLPWHLPEDLRHFRHTTLGGIVVMGRRTFESLPHLLGNRIHVVVTSQKQVIHPEDTKEHSPVYYTTMPELDDTVRRILRRREKRVFVIGGREMFLAMLPRSIAMHLTLIHRYFDGDVYVPELLEQVKDESEEIVRVSEHEGTPFQFIYLPL